MTQSGHVCTSFAFAHNYLDPNVTKTKKLPNLLILFKRKLELWGHISTWEPLLIFSLICWVHGLLLKDKVGGKKKLLVEVKRL